MEVTDEGGINLDLDMDPNQGVKSLLSSDDTEWLPVRFAIESSMWLVRAQS